MPIAIMAQQPRTTDADREYQAVGVIRYKVVFSERPDPIITNPVATVAQNKRARTEIPDSSLTVVEKNSHLGAV